MVNLVSGIEKEILWISIEWESLRMKDVKTGPGHQLSNWSVLWPLKMDVL